MHFSVCTRTITVYQGVLLQVLLFSQAAMSCLASSPSPCPLTSTQELWGTVYKSSAQHWFTSPEELPPGQPRGCWQPPGLSPLRDRTAVEQCRKFRPSKSPPSVILQMPTSSKLGTLRNSDQYVMYTKLGWWIYNNIAFENWVNLYE